MSIPGVGPLISTAVVAAIGSGEAFERGRDFAAWLGLVPRQYSTGGRSILGRISKRGSKYLRTLLIQAAKVLLMRPHNWARYSFGLWLNSASERLHKNKLAVALANKLAHHLERTTPRQAFRYPPRGRRKPAAASIELAIEELHGTDR